MHAWPCLRAALDEEAAGVYPKAGSKPLAMALPDYLDRRREATAIEDAARFRPRDATLMSGHQPEQLLAPAVTPSFFTTLARVPTLGGAFTNADATSGADRFAILTCGLWKSQLAGRHEWTRWSHCGICRARLHSSRPARSGQ